MIDETLGMTETQVRAELAAHGRTWEDFCAWMYGQTFAVDSKGQYRYYTHDVRRFCARGKAAVIHD